MYRVRSTDVWFNAPGVVAAYQPVACPDGALLARVNIANNQTRPGQYAATCPVPPSFNARTGWTGNGSTQYLATGIVPTAGWSAIVLYSGASAYAGAAFSSASDSGTFTFGVVPWWTDNNMYFNNGGYAGYGAPVASGVAAVAGSVCYLNGVKVATTAQPWSGTGREVYILASNDIGGITRYWNGNVLAIVVYRRILSAAELWHASRQMAYCHVNPDWSAWGRRRRYYYAPSLLAAMRRRLPGEVRVGSRGVIE